MTDLLKHSLNLSLSFCTFCKKLMDPCYVNIKGRNRSGICQSVNLFKDSVDGFA